ncbi:50S ribosomal protein L10 [Buchnera aphidicola]|nr:50S ribosomal protein L10 [Buchnera aphidicola]
MLNFQKKKEIVAEIHNTTKKALSIVLADLRDIKVNEITKLRALSRTIGVKIHVFKNTLTKLGIKNTQFECLKKILIGPMLIGYSIDHPRNAARLFREFSENNVNFKIVGAVFEKKILAAYDINTLADIPTYNEVLQRLIITIKEATLGPLMRILMSIAQNKK